MNIKLWYSNSMQQWRWTLMDDSLDQASGQQADLRDALEEIAKMVERFESK
jgi:hypothetical protein